MRKMFTTVTEQGTARAEDAICDECAKQHYTLAERQNDGLEDCTDNDALVCQWCGFVNEFNEAGRAV